MPPCDACDYPGIFEANLDAWKVFSNCGRVLFDGFGGINLVNARLVCEALGLTWDSEMVQKITQAAAAFLQGKERNGR